MPQKISTEMRDNLEYQLKAVEMLLRIYIQDLRDTDGDPGAMEGLEFFLHAGIILSVTAWETYIEDMISDAFTRKLAKATQPKDLLSTFNSVAKVWLSNQPKPPDLAMWTSDSWKDVIKEYFRTELMAINTPDRKNIRAISTKYLDFDLVERWSGGNETTLNAGQKLDELITLRGSLVHNPVKFYKESGDLNEQDVEDAIALINVLSEYTDEALQPEPVETIPIFFPPYLSSDESL